MSAFTDQTTSKEIARDIFLIRKETSSTISYEVDNAKYKRILFKMDFSGSQNLHLLTGGLEVRTTVQPYARVQVAVLRVTDPRKSSRLSVKYTWEEEEPSEPPSTIPKREELAQDIFVYTTRYHDPTSFHFAVFCGKYRRLRFTASFAGSSNLALDDGTQRRTVVVEPYQKVDIGTLRVVDASRGWTYKAKFVWEEDDIVALHNRARAPPAATPRTVAPSAVPQTSRQELARDLTLSTTRLDLGDGRTELVLTIDCIKYKNIRCKLDFSGSQNLRLISGTNVRGLVCTAFVSAYEKKEVARLRTRYSGEGWNLKQNVTFTEEDPAGTAPAPRAAVPHRRGSYNNVYQKQRDGTWRTGTQSSSAPTPYPAQLATVSPVGERKSAVPPPPPYEQDTTPTGSSARDRVMRAAQKTDFYRRASMNRGTSDVPAPPGITVAAATTTISVRELLHQLGLSVYLPLFQAEALDDMALLKSIANRGELRETLSELGISKIGHREKILKSVLEA